MSGVSIPFFARFLHLQKILWRLFCNYILINMVHPGFTSGINMESRFESIVYSCGAAVSGNWDETGTFLVRLDVCGICSACLHYRPKIFIMDIGLFVMWLKVFALWDFTSGNILSRFRIYEGQVERSLYKALAELHCLQWLRNRNDLVI